MNRRLHDGGARPDDVREVRRAGVAPPVRPRDGVRLGQAAGGWRSGHDLSVVSLLPPTAGARVAAPASGGEDRQSFALSVRIARREAVSGDRAAPGGGGVSRGGGAPVPAASRDRAEPGAAPEVPQTEVEGPVSLVESDAIAPTMTYAAPIQEAGTPGATEFGRATATPSIRAISVTADASASAFVVTADVVTNVEWSTQSLTRTDIPSETAAAITHANHATVAADLTPNMSSDNGRPPRSSFWASDLTARHERFHANEMASTYGRPAFEFASNWLAAQTAADAAEATRKTQRVPGKVIESLVASYLPRAEHRAYGDGAPSYKARADAITARGASNQYPGAPAP